jgi:hypothetical protein
VNGARFLTSGKARKYLPRDSDLARWFRAAMRTGYAIVIHSLVEGYVPLVRGEDNKPVIFPTERDAQQEIIDDLITRLQEYADGERDFEDAVTVEEFVVRVREFPDGSFEDEFGIRYT